MVQDNMVTIARDYANMHIPIPSSPTSPPTPRGFFARLRKPKRKDPFPKSKKDSADPAATPPDSSPTGVGVHSESLRVFEAPSKNRRSMGAKDHSKKVEEEAAKIICPTVQIKECESVETGESHTEPKRAKSGSKVEDKEELPQSKILETEDDHKQAHKNAWESRRKRLVVWFASMLCCIGRKTADL